MDEGGAVGIGEKGGGEELLCPPLRDLLSPAPR